MQTGKKYKLALILSAAALLAYIGCKGAGDTEVNYTIDPCEVCGNFPCTCYGPAVKLNFEPSDEAFANPMKGFRKDRYLNDNSFPSGEYVTVSKHYIRYNDLESSEADTAQKIKDWSNSKWAGIEDRNQKVIPRVVIVYPDAGEYWPSGLGSGDYVGRWLSSEFKKRIAAFTEKLGQAWDNDPRVAAVEMGIWGYWGEHHIWPDELPGGGDRIPADIQKTMGDAFANAFKNKKVMVRYPEAFTNYDFGYYWDSFASPGDKTGERMIQRDNWRTQMNSGEVAYDVGVGNILGNNPDETLNNTAYTNHVIDWIKKTHTSSLGWIANYNQNNPALRENAARMQKTFGYRFTVQSAAYNGTTGNDRALWLEFEAANTGSAPFYYKWPVEASLLDAHKQPVWKSVMNTDIRNWLPGKTYTAQGVFILPESLPKGSYTLALAVLDPAGNVPSLRFANKNYYNGGRMPLGKIGIGQEPDANSLGSFDSLYSDRSLYYIVN